MSDRSTGRYFIGLMSGTSLDAIDIALTYISNDHIELVHSYALPIEQTLKTRIAELFEPGNNEIDRMGELDREIAEISANGVINLLAECGVSASEVTAIGSHGQTIRHRPYGMDYKQPFTLQIGDPNTLAALTNIVTVADFRRKDIALGGQGAPLAPAFHSYLCQSHERPCAVLNIGGIANLSLIRPDSANTTTGFDTGPGNGLMDAWIYRHKSLAYDNNGEWALEGSVHHELLDALLSDPFFDISGPKSTGKEYFNLAWLEQILASNSQFGEVNPADVQATLLSLSALTIAQACAANKDINSIYLCGGGALNKALVKRLSDELLASLETRLDTSHSSKLNIQSTEALGIHPMWIEAAAFAWMAQQTIDRLPVHQQGATGAARNAILGGIFIP